MPRANLSSLSLLLAYLFLLSTLGIARALPPPSPSSSSFVLPQRRADPDPQPCGFDGDDNTYGLGIRLGLYIQWLSTMLCNFLGLVKPEEAKSMKGINLCFQVSVFGGLLYVTATRGRTQEAGQLYAAEIWVMLCLCLGGVLTVSPEPRERAYIVHDVFQQGLNVAMASYTLWFIYTRMDQMAHSSCSRYSFFYTKVDMYHWFRLFWKISMIPATISVTFCLGWCLVRTFTPGMRRLSDDAELAWGQSHPLLWVISPSFALGSTIASTELIIRWNHIHNVNSIGGTGQLIPLIVACLTFIRLAYKLFTQMRSNKATPPTNTPSLMTSTSLHLTI
ncbi:hypothetical protein M407DRAFT_22967 [Tulasnella calospora MUT 4182]|uniref:Uncharacterized protein n=1 Tax=Tulasnella calospora MUT 4182 TaxID=1051891 RepID=A0A0C3L218_9AGAM|nr:hypothetical protein M407DRAFT_22967 [Tulasnella calospora MUT 4182]